MQTERAEIAPDAPDGSRRALLQGGLVEDIGALMAIEHVAMLPSMLVAMLLRRDEYTGSVHRHGREQVAA